MKQLILIAFSILIIFSTNSLYGRGRGSGGYHSSRGVSSGSRVHVRGYTKRNGTYVMPHIRTSPNKTKMDNFSTKGNVNPYTGKEGTVDP